MTPQQALDNIREIHRHGGVIWDGYPDGWCIHDHLAWPCPTIRVIDTIEENNA